MTDSIAADDRARVEALASEMAREIKLKADYRSAEYVGVIYRKSDGSIEKSELFANGSFHNAPLGKAISENTTTAEVLAAIHNHPEKIVRRQASQNVEMNFDINKLPSAGDWKNAESIFKDRHDVTYYILGPDDKLRQYEYRDRDEWKDKIEPRYWQRHHRRYPTGPEVEYELPPALEADPAAHRGPFNDPVLDKAFVALMDGDSDALDRIAADFSRSPDGQQMRQLGDSLLAEQNRQQQLAQQEAFVR